MTESRHTLKKTIRRQVRAWREALTPAEAATLSQRIMVRLLSLGAVMHKQVFHLYYPIRNEVDTRPLCEELWRLGKTVVMPRSDFTNRSLVHYQVSAFDQLEPTSHDLLEPRTDLPMYAAECDVIVVPGVAFDRHRNRLGYGAGFYDVFLAHATGLKVAPAYAGQIVAEIPAEPHDIHMDLVITESDYITGA
jgi:5-formyltetrahydrofolate cyclo-ligase